MIVCGLSNTVVKDNLMATKEVTLEMAFDRCRMAEATKEQVTVIQRSGDGSVEAVRVTKKVTNHARRKDRRESFPGVELGVVLPLARHVILARVLVIFNDVSHYYSKKAKAPVQPFSVEDEVFAVGPIVEGVPDAQKNASTDSKAFHVGAIDGTGASWRQSLSTNGRTVEYKLDKGYRSISCLMKFISVSLHEHVYMKHQPGSYAPFTRTRF